MIRTRSIRGSLIAAAILCVASMGVVAQVISVPASTAVAPADLFSASPNGQGGAQPKYVTAAMINGVVGYQTSTPVTAFSLAFSNPGQTYWLITPAGTLATGTFTLAAAPGDGQRNCMRSSQTQTAVTLAVGASTQTINTPITAMTANTSYCFLWVAAASTWYPI